MITWRKSSYSNGEGGNCVEVGAWHKSSYSNGEGGECVEIGSWRKSSHSNGSGGDCIEVGDGVLDTVPVRDSKDPDGPKLLFSTAGWTAFLAAVKNDEF